MQITPDQIRAARALLRMSQAELAEQAHLTQTAVTSIEDGGGPDSSAVDAVGRVLQDAGVEFIPWGVRRRPPLTPDQQRMFDELMAISRRGAELAKQVQPLTDDDLYDENGSPA